MKSESAGQHFVRSSTKDIYSKLCTSEGQDLTTSVCLSRKKTTLLINFTPFPQCKSHTSWLPDCIVSPQCADALHTPKSEWASDLQAFALARWHQNTIWPDNLCACRVDRDSRRCSLVCSRSPLTDFRWERICGEGRGVGFTATLVVPIKKLPRFWRDLTEVNISWCPCRALFHHRQVSMADI